MKKICALVLLLSLSLVLVFALDFVSGYEIFRDVSYGDLDCEVMDIYIPGQAYNRQTNGCVLLIHGGSWSGGDKEEETFMCRYLASRGYIAATMNYSFCTAESYSVDLVLDEIDMALEKLKSFASERGIVIDRAATSGYSAGAHLSMLYAFSRGESTPLEIAFTANLAGPADMDAEIWGDDLSIRIGEILCGYDITDAMIESGEAEEIIKSISPVSYVNSDSPPSIFAYGGKDTLVKKANGESLVSAFEEAGVDYDYILFKNSDHSMIIDFGRRIDYMIKIVDYCDKYFS